MQMLEVKPMGSFKNILSGAFDFVQLAPDSILSSTERNTILDCLSQTAPTFDLAPYPPCWGKAFENYLTMQEYLSPEPNDKLFAQLCAPANAKAIELLSKMGLQVEILRDAESNQTYTVGDFRSSLIEAGSSILHIDDLGIDGSVKPDFVLPKALQGKNYIQLSLIVFLESQKDAVLRVYDRRYSSEDDKFRLENGWQFSDEVIANAGYFDFKPKVGDSIIMPNQYFHDVMGSSKDDNWMIYSLYLLHLPEENKVFLYI